MTVKASIYKEEDFIEHSELLAQLYEAVTELENKMKAGAPIVAHGDRVGWGVNKRNRSIAADRVISIARAIKSLKGW